MDYVRKSNFSRLIRNDYISKKMRLKYVKSLESNRCDP